MAQTIKLKRSSTAGKVPGTGNLALGELAINTYDGRIFFKKNDGSDAVEHIVTTDSITTGSISLTSKVTAATLTLSGLSAQNSEATSLMINGSGVVGTRELGSNAFNSTSFLTEHPNISAGSNISQNNSNGTVIQDLTITLDSNGHVTTATAGTVNLDGRYYTETESDTLYTKKLGQGVISGSSQIDHDQTTNFNTNEHFTQANITTVGTIGTGVWQGTAIASAYLDSDTAHLSGTQTFSGAKTFSSDLTISNAAPKIYLTDTNNNDDFIIANTNGVFQIQDDVGARFQVQSSGVVEVKTSTQSTSKTTGGLVVDGGVGIAKTLNVGEDVVAYASSDERYKDNVTPIENPNDKIKQIGGYTFDWNDKHEVFKGQHDVGVIAQEIEKVLPEIVETRESGYKAVKYEKIVALLIESNKELLKRVEELESKIK
jgi:hypothetical protein